MIISDFLNYLQANSYIWFFLAIATFASFVLGYRAMPQKKIKCIKDDRELIKNSQSQFSKIDILYDGKSVDSLTVTKVTFWNSSFPTINNQDLIEKDPFTVTVKNGEILDVSVLEGKDTSNEVGIEKINESSAKIFFEFLDRKEGGVVQVVHTGDENSVNISKKIKGGKIVSSYTGKFEMKFYGCLLSFFIFCGFFLIISVTNTWGILPDNWYSEEFNIISEDYVAIYYGIFVFIILLYTSILFFIMMRYSGIGETFIPKNCKLSKKSNKRSSPKS